MSDPTRKTNKSATGLASRVASLDWLQIGKDLDAYGCAVAEGVLLRDQCRALSALYDQDAQDEGRSSSLINRVGAGLNEPCEALQEARALPGEPDHPNRAMVDTHSGSGEEIIQFAIRRSSLGLILIASSIKGICAILLGDQEKALTRIFAVVFQRRNGSRINPGSRKWPPKSFGLSKRQARR
jgi:hypothetical protein